MSIEKFRSAFDMSPPIPRDLATSIAAVWERAHLHGRRSYPCGVTKFRSLEEAQAAREAWNLARLKQLRLLATRE